MIRGIGPVYAKKLVRAFGEAVFDVVEQVIETALHLELQAGAVVADVLDGRPAVVRFLSVEPMLEAIDLFALVQRARLADRRR
jgi:hypothetical protein